MKCTQTLHPSDILKQFVRENPGTVAIYAVFLLLVPLTDIGIPHMVGRLIQTVKNTQTALQKRTALYVNFAIIVALIALGQFGHVLSDTVDVQMLPQMVKLVRNLIVQHVFDIQSKHYTELRTGELTTKLIKLPVVYFSFVEQWKNNWLPELVILFSGIAYLLFKQFRVGLILLAVTLVILYYSYQTVFHCESISQARDKAYNATIEEVEDILRNSMSVINANQQENELKRINTFHEDYATNSKKTFTCSLRPRFIYLPVIIALFMVYMLYSYYQIRQNEIQIASFVVVLLIVVQVITSLFKLLGNVKDTVLKWGSMQHSMKVFEECKNETFDVFRSNPPKEGIFIDRLSYHYETDDGKRPVFNDYSLYIPMNQCTVIEGKIGSGKSTLMKLLNKYYAPTSGQIYINGMSYDLLSTTELHRILGYVPQSPSLFNRSIYENIVYGVESPPSKTEVEDWLRAFNIYELVNELPKGLDTSAGKNGGNISGGQRQIVWFLRVLLHNTPYVLLDEPTSAMDNRTKEYVYRLIEKVKEQKTVILVSHDERVRRYADHRVVMETQ
jgi:ABC-type multidrug transport system fused ATPase/permease subunit